MGLFSNPKIVGDELDRCLAYYEASLRITIFQDKEANLFNNTLVKYLNVMAESPEAAREVCSAAVRLVQATKEVTKRHEGIQSVPEAAFSMHQAWRVTFLAYTAWAEATLSAMEALADGITPHYQYVQNLLYQFQSAEGKAQVEEKRFLKRLQVSPETIGKIISRCTIAEEADMVDEFDHAYLSANAKNYRILAINDNPRQNEDWEYLFTEGTHADIGFEIDSASQGQEGLQKIRQAFQEGRPYVVAFVDVRMPPGWDGVNTIDRIWKDYPDLPVIIHASYSDYSAPEIIEKLGTSEKLLIFKNPPDYEAIHRFAVAITKEWECEQAKHFEQVLMRAAELPWASILDPDWIRKLAEEGDVLCMFYLGSLYLYGREGFLHEHSGFQQDRSEAIRWLLKAAHLGNQDAKNKLVEIGEWKEPMTKSFAIKSQHYVFVHCVLRDLFFDSPDKIIMILQNESRNDSLLDLWSRVGDTIGESGLVAPDGLCCEIRIHDETTIAIITLPTPRVMCEAYFVGLVYRPSAPGRDALTHFITLEHDVDRAVLCGWSDTNSHYNMGYQCEPDFDDFFQEVCKICDSEFSEV